jgi:hypothetical protein
MSPPLGAVFGAAGVSATTAFVTLDLSVSTAGEAETIAESMATQETSCWVLKGFRVSALWGVAFPVSLRGWRYKALSILHFGGAYATNASGGMASYGLNSYGVSKCLPYSRNNATPRTSVSNSGVFVTWKSCDMTKHPDSTTNQDITWKQQGWERHSRAHSLHTQPKQGIRLPHLVQVANVSKVLGLQGSPRLTPATSLNSVRIQNLGAQCVNETN